MKRIITLIISFAMLLTFVSCSSGPEFSLGTVEGDTYTSEFIGIGFKYGDNWRFYSDKEIKELNQTVENVADDEYLEAMKNADVVYDMMAINTANQTDNVNVTLEKVNPVTLATLDIAENYEKTVSTVKSTLENMGCSNIKHEVSEVTIDGKEYTCLNITSELGGMKMYQTSVAIKCNGYLANIAVASYGEDRTADILGYFYFLD